jgi:hypothetical protein
VDEGVSTIKGKERFKEVIGRRKFLRNIYSVFSACFKSPRFIKNCINLIVVMNKKIYKAILKVVLTF